ncbi:MAG: hypothetical protein KKH72_09495 [Alphaproteobacteria bacterium]|nr:hypothetical protein [Alphaproteobacteria bacterium]
MKLRLAMALGLAATLAIPPVAAEEAGLFGPRFDTSLMQSARFDGPYAGIAVGLMNANQMVFYPNANGYRVPAGVFAGYNSQLTPWMFAGVEAQFEGAYEWQDNTFGTNAFALARLGLLTADDFAVYQMAGLGLIDGNSAYALGIGAEQSLGESFALRTEALSFGQLAARSGVAHYGGVMGMKITAGALWYLGDGRQSIAEASAFEASPFDASPTRFSGRYFGVYAGGGYNPSHTFFGGDTFYGWHITRFFQGGIAGWNYDTGTMFRIGSEVQGGINYNTSGQIGTDIQALARVGAVPMDGVMVYAAGGVGMIENIAAYALGGGVEYALWGHNTARLDVQALGQINPGPPYNTPGFSAVKATVGTLWHFD